MRLALLAGLAVLFVSRTARAQELEPDEPWIELGQPPPPPPGAEEELETDGPAPPQTDKEPEALAPAPPSPEPGERLVSDDPSLDRGTRDVSVSMRGAPKAWYGWQILIADGAAAVWAFLPPPAGLIYGGGTYLIAAPSIHIGHKRGLAALGSFALRLGVPLAATALIDGDDHCYDGCIGPGLALGAVVVSVIDTVWIAREDEKLPPKQSTTITPGFAVTREGAALSVGGVF